MTGVFQFFGKTRNSNQQISFAVLKGGMPEMPKRC